MSSIYKGFDSLVIHKGKLKTAQFKFIFNGITSKGLEFTKEVLYPSHISITRAKW